MKITVDIPDVTLAVGDTLIVNTQLQADGTFKVKSYDIQSNAWGDMYFSITPSSGTYQTNLPKGVTVANPISSAEWGIAASHLGKPGVYANTVQNTQTFEWSEWAPSQNDWYGIDAYTEKKNPVKEVPMKKLDPLESHDWETYYAQNKVENPDETFEG